MIRLIRRLASIPHRLAMADIWEAHARRMAAQLMQAYDALEPLANRATTPGSDVVPDDGTITLFMKDARAAQRVCASTA